MDLVYTVQSATSSGGSGMSNPAQLTVTLQNAGGSTIVWIFTGSDVSDATSEFTVGNQVTLSLS